MRRFRLFDGVCGGILLATAGQVPIAAQRVADVELFSDVTAEAGIEFRHFNGMSGRFYYPEVIGAGGALFDYDNDGDLDLYLVQGAMLGPDRTLADALEAPTDGTLSDRLYRNELLSGSSRGTLRFVDRTGASGIAVHEYGMGVATGDFDNDGWVDLYVANFGPNRLLRNRRDGTFGDETEASGAGDERWSVSASAVDFDRDGHLDLMVVNYVDFSYVNHKICISARGEKGYCLPGSYRPVADRLLRNRGDGTFEDVSAAAGILAVPGNGLGVVAADFDGDRWPDLYVANDLMANRLWLNEGDGRFVDDALSAGCAVNADGDAEAGMGVDAADFDGDGDADLFLSHFSNETNTLYTNAGDASFRDATAELGLATPSWNETGFGTAFLDYDNDGWLDLVVVNGRVNFRPGADPGSEPYPLDEPNQLFRNLDGRGFADVSARAGPAFRRSEVSRGAAAGDVDNDGDMDLLVTNNNGPARLLRNDVGSRQDWIGLRLVLGRRGEAQRDALGAVAILDCGGDVSLRRQAKTDGSYASARDPRLLFGLGRGCDTAALRVIWPDGSDELWQSVPRHRYTILSQGSTRAKR